MQSVAPDKGADMNMVRNDRKQIICYMFLFTGPFTFVRKSS